MTTVSVKEPVVLITGIKALCPSQSNGDGPNDMWNEEYEDETYIYRIKNV